MKIIAKKYWMQIALVVAVLLVIVLISALFSTKTNYKEMSENYAAQNAMIAGLQDQITSMERKNEVSPVITSDVIREKMKSLRELVTAEYYYTTSGSYKVANKATVIVWPVDIPFTTKEFTVLYDGIIKAGVDLELASIDVDEEKHLITVHLPSSRIMSNEPDEKSLVVVTEKDALFNNITISDYNDFVAENKQDIEKKAIQRGLLERADDEAKTVVEEFLKLLPGMDEYTLMIL